MTALEALRKAQSAGLTLEAAPGGLKIRGPKKVGLALVPQLAPLAGEILRLLAPQNRGAEVAPSGPGALNPCAECGRDAPVAMLLDDGRRMCRPCLFPPAARSSRGRAA
jgi:hypothetical protein